MPVVINDTGQLEYTSVTTEELLDFIVKQTILMQDASIRQDLAYRTAEELSHKVGSAKLIIEQAYAKLRKHLNDRATRQRHTTGVP